MSRKNDELDIEGELRSHFANEDQISDRATATAKDLFALGRVDDAVGSLLQETAVTPGAVRGDDDVLRFVSGKFTVDVSMAPGRLHLLVRPPAATVTVEPSSGAAIDVELDDTGGASLAVEGPLRLSIAADGVARTVFDALLVPRL